MPMIEAQSQASNPTHSVWVAANAGTGKTKVLTDRVLRLLLAGTLPARILCITYTKAASAEMENRIQDTLRKWVGLEDIPLANALEELTGTKPTAKLLQTARQLFATVLDAPDGVRIQTIHGFCQSLLKRFPLEARLHPQIEVMDERTAQEFLNEAKQRLFALISREPEHPVSTAVEQLIGRLAENSFQELLDQLVRDRRNLLSAQAAYQSTDAMIEACGTALGVDKNASETELVRTHFAYDTAYTQSLRELAANMCASSKKTDTARGAAIAKWLALDEEARPNNVGNYISHWLTQKMQPTKDLATKDTLEKYPDADDLLRREQQRAVNYWHALCALNNWKHTKASLEVCDLLLRYYSELKENHNVLDYDDLILHSLHLLKSVDAQWVLYKLDGGLDHLLIDEAQDTSPEQWQLVEALISDFFTGNDSRAGDALDRTLFVVGDDKQSIYRFQGAQPKAFGEKRQLFASSAQQAGRGFAKVPMVLSFRSTDAVLKAVDATFAQPNVRAGVSYDDVDVRHQVFRNGEAGMVELWPLMMVESEEESDVFNPKEASELTQDASVELAERIANKVASWLANSTQLEAKGRAIQPSDVLVLVRRRGQFMEQMVRAFKQAGVPVAGMDRMNLPDSLAVADLLALSEFLLLPHDDLNLACALKSPLVGLDEDALFSVCYGRPKGMSVWERMQQIYAAPHCPPVVSYAHDLLATLLAQVDYIRPYELFSTLLDAHGARARLVSRLGDEVLDAVEEFLSLALFYENSHAPSLQGFMRWVQSGKVEVVRDMDQGQNLVRVMTVHGAKGLQAPIVFLPDTVSAPTQRGNQLWGEVDGNPMLLISPSSTEDAPLTASLRDDVRRAEAEEYRRLLYVAMTRAEDRLYIGGWKPKARNISDDCWYRWMEEGLKPLMEEVTEEDNVVWRMTCPQEKAVQVSVQKQEWRTHAPLPEVLLQAPVPEPFPPQPLAPSRMEGDDSMFISPNATAEDAKTDSVILSPVADSLRFQRGNLMHAMLQWLPDITEVERPMVAERYLAQQAANIAPQLRDDMISDVLRVMTDPAMAPVFEIGSMAEVPLTGLIGEGHVLSGQIDRLCVRDDGIWVIDYKTQRQPPKRVEDVPPVYLRQMAIYAQALASIYPNKPIHAALLWTTGPALMPLPAKLLAAALDSTNLPRVISSHQQ